MGVDALSTMEEGPADRARFDEAQILPGTSRHPIGDRRIVVPTEPDETHQEREDNNDQRNENGDFDDPTPPFGYSVLYGAFVRCRNSNRKSRRYNAAGSQGSTKRGCDRL